MLSDPALLSTAPLPAQTGVCDLCGTAGEVLRTSVVVRHERGGTVALAACDRCAAAVRRLIALAGGASAAGAAQITVESEVAPESQAAPTVVKAEPLSSDVIGEPVEILELSEPFRAEDGQVFVVRVCGQERSDATWIGWLTFVSTDGRVVRSTPRETTQSSREHLKYWATGLQPSYAQGAFHRTGA
jgi:hypothetical protein